MGKYRMPIYIVDDNTGISPHRMLNSREIEASYSKSAGAFLGSVSRGRRRIAVVDLRMPECDGFSLMEKMYALHYDIPVIVITGQTLSDSRETTMQRGTVGFLEKPFDEESLLALIEQLEKQGA